ncbi:MAG: hypothetical protein CK431_03275 [Mycobacterium sp.]|nr:MAG: hypothetical protein CK431_03275 [Mycobacterium sp.]
MRAIGAVEQPLPLVAVLEVSGAVLTWIVDDPGGADAAEIHFTDPARADWLWQVVGESGHVALLSAAGEFQETDGLDIAPGSLAPLHRLALGHWLRRWWPASQRDGIPALDRALLDAEVALRTVGAQGFFTDDTLDSDVPQLLAPHAPALTGHAHSDNSRVRELVRASAELADEVGLDGEDWAELSVAVEDSVTAPSMPTGYRDDYALAAGSQPVTRQGTAIGRGVASINWGAVPPGIFDAAEDTVDWSVEAAGPAVVAVVRAAVIGPEPATDVPVRVRSGDVSGAGALDAGGRATVPLVDGQRGELTESAAWNHDWPATSVVVGAPMREMSEPREARDRIRAWVRARLEQPPADAYLAEILASESSY